ncbi:MAG: isochorismatase family protein, partial [Candidatus Krumholzibacteria bacterium]|nr:isochorismatase family protein [Candidatus Krumholzibacteria bacterium]
EQGPKPGTEPFEFPKTVDIKDDDPMIIKNYPSSFTKTDLEKVLRDDGCNAVFLCGLSATGCVLATYYGALDRDLVAVMVERALLSPDVLYTRVVEDFCTSMTLEKVEETLKGL